MTDAAFVESGMTFGPYPPGHCFRIEQSKTYQAVQDGVKIAEFLLLELSGAQAAVVVVEAKSSAPSPENAVDFQAFLVEIEEKLRNAVCLCVASVLGRHPLSISELPIPFKNFDPSTVRFKFLLVLRGHKKEWLPPLQEAMKKKLRPVINMWGAPLATVAVVNDDMARSGGYIQ